MSLYKDFKAFIMRGNVLDLAVGVIIGGAFGKIVSSLVEKVLMPPIGLLLGKVNFMDLKFVLQSAVLAPDGKVIEPEVAIGYGAFIQSNIDFIIIAFCIFMVIKIYNKMLRKQDETPKPPSPPTKEEELLTEIRDLLKENRNSSK